MGLTNQYFKLLTRIVRRSQALLGASTIGVRALVINQADEILLVRHTYTPGWHFPGGGVDAGESAKEAVIRELWEETGVIVQEKIDLYGVYYHKVNLVDDYPVLYIVKEFTQQTVSCPEIAESAWFHYSSIPKDSTPATKRRIAEYFYHQPILAKW